MLKWVKAAGALILFLVFYHIPVEELKRDQGVKALYHHDFTINASVLSDFAKEVPPVIFHRGIGEPRNGYHSRYHVYKLSGNGQNLVTIELPPAGKKIKSELFGNISFQGSGFLTYPENGNFYTWYPRLGNQILFFDEKGRFLWAKASSHYLRAAPSGKWILAMAGDQSRAFFFYPDMKPIASVEGALMLSSSFAAQKEREVLYLAFLGGEVVRFDLAAKKPVRFLMPGPVKSVTSSPSGEKFLAQVEKQPGKDTLIAAKPGEGSDYAIEFEIELPRSYPATLPLARTETGIAWMTPAEGGYEIHLADQDGALQESIAVASASESGIDDWRANLVADGVLFWSSKQYLVVEKTLLLHRKLEIENAKTNENYFFLQNSSGVMAFEVY